MDVRPRLPYVAVVLAGTCAQPFIHEKFGPGNEATLHSSLTFPSYRAVVLPSNSPSTGAQSPTCISLSLTLLHVPCPMVLPHPPFLPPPTIAPVG